MDEFLHQCSELLDMIALEKKDVPIGGDFNIDLLRPCQAQDDYCQLFTSMGFEQLVQSPTRVTNNTSTPIDHLWSRRRGRDDTHIALVTRTPERPKVYPGTDPFYTHPGAFAENQSTKLEAVRQGRLRQRLELPNLDKESGR